MDLQKLISDLVKNHEFSFICPNCKKEAKVKINDNGSIIKCPNCNSDIKVESTVEV